MLQDFTSTLRGIVLKCLENIKRDYLCYINPPAPKVLRRGSLAVDATGQICQTGTASARGRPFCISAQHRLNAPLSSDTAAKSAPLGVNFGQQRSNFGPTWTPLAPTSAHLGSKMAQLGPKLDPFGSNFSPS